MVGHGSYTSTSGSRLTGLEPTTKASSGKNLAPGRGGGRGGGPRERTGVARRYKFNNYRTGFQTTPNGDSTYNRDLSVPPPAPVLQSKRLQSEAFFVNAGDFASSKEIKLTVEFPTKLQQDRTNDVAMYFKRFATVLLSAHPSIAILNWENPEQNPVTKAVDISPAEESISQYFSGIVVQANRRKIKGFVKIRSDVTFGVIKRNDRVWSWLTKNKVYVRTTSLSQSRHVNLGWIVHSHPEYVNQALATQDLKRRTNSTEVRFELLPHSITHTTAEGTKITTKALKLRVEYDYRQELFKSLLTCFAKGNEDERLTCMSNTAEWKLIPFANNTLSRDQMTALVKKQNKYLHDVHAIPFINLGSLEGKFYATDALRKGFKRKKDDYKLDTDKEYEDHEMEITGEMEKGAKHIDEMGDTQGSVDG